MVDKGKVLRNVFKKKLAEYVQAKEQKGDQDVHSETVPTTKGAIVKPQQRSRYELNIEFETKQGQKTNIPVIANLSVAEKRKLENFAKYISNSIRLESSALVVERLNNLLKRVVAESGNYSVDFADGMINLLDAINSNFEKIVKKSSAKEGLQGVRNVLNQLTEVLQEKKEEILATEEGVPAIGQEDIKKVDIPFLEVEPEKTKRSITLSSSKKKKNQEEKPLTFDNDYGNQGSNSVDYREKAKENLIQRYNEIIVSTPEERNSVHTILQKLASKINKSSLPIKSKYKNQSLEGRYKTVVNQARKLVGMSVADFKLPAFEEVEEGEEGEEEPPSAPAQVEEQSSAQPAFIAPPSPRPPPSVEQKFGELQQQAKPGKGMRKTKQNTYRGYTGYGHQMSLTGCGDAGQVQFSTTPAVDKGFATAPMNANSPFNQPAYRSRQTNSIPKYLNFNYIPNERGNFAVIED